jgi:1-acyl-sn-glycerol-3-phosphate acyltransferase
MSALRSTARAAGIATWTGLLFALLILVRVLPVVSSTPRDALRARLFRVWSRGVARILGLEIAASGEAPRGEFLLVANHLSYLDVVVLGSLLEATFVAKAEVARWPVVGIVSRSVQTVFIDRGRKRDLLRVLPLLERRLRSGGSVVLFPEGTTSDGSGVLPFKSSLFEVAVRTRRPAHVASLSYSTPAGAPHPARAVCWWGDMTFWTHLTELLRLPGLKARVEFAPVPLFAADRKRLARVAEREVWRHFIPVTGGDSPCLPAPL